MTSFATTAVCVALALGLGCTKQTSTTDQGVAPPKAPDVTVELSGVTLGDDCGSGWTPPPPTNRPPAPATPAPATPAAVAPSRTAPAGDCAPGDDCGGGGRYQCRQTSVQLSLQARGTTSPTPIKLKKVELLDAQGGFLAELSSSSPTRWSDAGSYQPWDQVLAPNEQAAVSYVLSSPAWHAMEGGQYGQSNKVFQLRVTVLVGDKDRVIEKKAIQPTIMPPAVPT